MGILSTGASRIASRSVCRQSALDFCPQACGDVGTMSNNTITKEHLGQRLLVRVAVSGRTVCATEGASIPVMSAPTERTIREFSPDGRYVQLAAPWHNEGDIAGTWHEVGDVELLCVLGEREQETVKVPLRQENIRPMTVLDRAAQNSLSAGLREADDQQARWRAENEPAKPTEGLDHGDSDARHPKSDDDDEVGPS